MIATTARFAAFAAVLLASANAQTCNTAPYGSCGSNAGVTCCPAGQYCQPWDAGFFQCIVPPAKCSQQFTNIDFYGNDIKTVSFNFAIQVRDYCDECAKTPGCTSYTFDTNASPIACYLKSSSENGRRTVIGVVSGLLD